MTKQHIIDEIKRTALANGGIPLGRLRFFEETGIKESDWSGKYWARWNDAITEAGFPPNKMQASYSDDFLLECYSFVILSLGHIPTSSELRLRSNHDVNFPSHNTFSRLGSKIQIIAKVFRYCSKRDHLKTVCEICSNHIPGIQNIELASTSTTTENVSNQKIGYVYLIQHGSRREYKIGKTYNPIRREGEIRLQLPERLTPVHYIETDDPSGIEQYWHNRFAYKRKEGEWFELSPQEVIAFKRWRKIY